MKKTIKQIKQGTLFRLKDTETAPVWVRGEYIPQAKKYSTYRYDDINHERLMKGDSEVFIDFEF